MKDAARANCPQCGAVLEFRYERSVFRVCDNCRSALVRKGVALESIGLVATLVPTPSLLRLGLRGKIARDGRFTVAGRLQLDWGAGTWDEWFVQFDDGSIAWLSEAMGRFHLMRKVDAVAPGGCDLRTASLTSLVPPIDKATLLFPDDITCPPRRIPPDVLVADFTLAPDQDLPDPVLGGPPLVVHLVTCPCNKLPCMSKNNGWVHADFQ